MARVFRPDKKERLVLRFAQPTVDKIDLLIAIDNSRSMADKRQILAQQG